MFKETERKLYFQLTDLENMHKTDNIGEKNRALGIAAEMCSGTEQGGYMLQRKVIQHCPSVYSVDHEFHVYKTRNK